jgi:hypothetical protein
MQPGKSKEGKHINHEYSLRASQRRTVLSPDAVANKSPCLGSQHNWSTLSVCPFNSISFALLCSPKTFHFVISIIHTILMQVESNSISFLSSRYNVIGNTYMSMWLNVPNSSCLINRPRCQLFPQAIPCHRVHLTQFKGRTPSVSIRTQILNP